jgi:Flp pilus assembly protein TadG
MKNRQKGVAIIEFALILPFLLLLSFFTIEFGRAIWQYNTLTKSVRDGARYLSTQPPGNAAAITAARNLIVYGNPAGTGAPLAIGLSTSNVRAQDIFWLPVTSTAVNGSAPLINTVTVRIHDYRFNSMWTSVFGLPFGQVPFSDITATMRSAL